MRRASLTVSELPQPLPVTGNWKLALEGVRFPKLERQVNRLESWTEDAETRHFSGTGTYESDFDLPKEYVREDFELILEMGSVGNVAEVLLNGRSAGVCWMQPYRLTVTKTARAGANHLKIMVTNTLQNHVAGLKQMPEVPEEVVAHYGPTTNIYVMGERAFKRDAAFKPLPASGLMGPVRIIARRKVTLRLA